MFKKILKNSDLFLLTACFVLIPLADARIFSGIPIYYIDASLTLLFLHTLYYHRHSLQGLLYTKNFRILLALTTLVFISALFNNPSLTTLGLLKSWFLLPLVTFTTYFYAHQEKGRVIQMFLRAWFIGTLCIAGLAFYGLAVGQITFDGRLIGTFTSPNFLGYFLFPGALMALYFYGQYKSTAQGFFIALSIPFFIAALFYTQSLGALLALAAAILTYGSLQLYPTLLSKKVILGGFIFLLVSLPVAVVVCESVVNNFTGERSSLASRVIIWRTATKVVADNPLFGIGAGNFQKTYLEYQSYFPPYLEWAVPQPHNFIFALWLQFGFLGMALLGYILWTILCTVKEKSLSAERQLLIALLVGTLSYGIFDTPLFGNALAVVWWSNLLVLFFWPQEKEPLV